MRNLDWAKARNAILFFGLIFVFAQITSVQIEGQTRRKSAPVKKKTPAAKPKPRPTVDPNLPKVTQIDEIALKNLLRREGENSKPLLINFWATWCEPCREEFPDLVKIDAEYKGKIDFITVSLDYPSEIGRDVPKFLGEMKAEMPAYLLKTQNEDAAIALVSPNWKGSLPFTILFDPAGNEVYSVPKKVKLEILRAEIDKLLASLSAAAAADTK
jgi:thiol-disulfide isomerase/thioredoxin